MSIVYCDDCDEQICSDCDGEDIGHGRYLCIVCFDQREEDRSAGVAENDLEACGKCGARTRNWINKIEGKRCLKCAHALEIDLLGAAHDAENCTICTPQKAA